MEYVKFFGSNNGTWWIFLLQCSNDGVTVRFDIRFVSNYLHPYGFNYWISLIAKLKKLQLTIYFIMDELMKIKLANMKLDRCIVKFSGKA